MRRLVGEGVFVLAEGSMDPAAYRLSEDDVPGASLKGRLPELLTVVELKRWLACRGARRTGKKAELVKR